MNPSLADRAFGMRNRILSSARFQAWAGKFPLTKGIARRRATGLFDLCAGFVYSQVLFAAVRLDLFAVLAEGPQTASEIAPRIGLDEDATERLLEACASLSLAERRDGGRFGLGVHGASFLGNPGVAKMVEHHALLFRDLVDPIALLRGEHEGTELRKFWSYGADGAASGYSELMASSLGLVANDVLDAYAYDRHECLLDVGGGEGAFLEAAAARAPRLSLMLFDLPPVAKRAKARLTQAGLGERATVVAGDVFQDPLPKGADLVSLVRIMHDHDDAAALRILRAVRRAIRPGGVLLVAEPMAATPGAESVGAYFSFYLLAMGQGRPRSAGELTSLLRDSGFSDVRAHKTRLPVLTSLLEARAS